jgi:hypothetical protein
MGNTKQQLETLFGKLVITEANCPACGAKLPRVETRTFFLDGLVIYCGECNLPVRANSLTPPAQGKTAAVDETNCVRE